MNLVKTYVETVCGSGEPHRYAVDCLNDDLRSRYTLRRLYEWRAGTRAVPQRVQAHMLRVVIERVMLQSTGLSGALDDRVLDEAAARLSPPAAKRGIEKG